MTVASATSAVTTREAAAPLHPRCAWPNVSSSGCRSSSSRAGSGQSYGVTPTWPMLKLATNRRSEAIRRARQLELI